jgi:hypothetical protein
MDYKKLEELLKRLNNIFDKNYSVITAFPEVNNPDLFLKEKILEEKDETLVEQRLAKIEAVDTQWKRDIAEQKLKDELDKVIRRSQELMRQCDYTQLPDAEYIEQDFRVRSFTQEEKLEWREYRKYLRRIPRLFKNKQILELRVMGFEEWRLNKPLYKD